MLRVFVLGLLGGISVGCPSGGTLENSETFNKACDARPILRENCAGSLCHGTEDGPSEPEGGIDLLSVGFEERIVGKQATYAGVDVADLPSCQVGEPEYLVDTVAPEKSLLLTKLNGTHRCGEGMPLGAPLDDGAIRCVRSFVFSLAEAGTPNGQGGTNSMTPEGGRGGAQ